MRIASRLLDARAPSAICVPALALLMSSCEPHINMTNQSAEVRIELDAVQRSTAQVESELARLTKEENELRSTLPLRLGSETTVRKNNVIRMEVEGLKKRKAELESSMPLFEADLDSYRKKYL